MKFDINAARSAGYSDDEIADYLATENKFDLGGALKSGYSSSEVIDFLSAPKGGQQDLPEGIAPSEGRSATPMGEADPRLIKPQDDRGIIDRVTDFLKPAPFKSVMEDYKPTEQELQADVDRRLSYGAGPISSQTAAKADLARSGIEKADSPIVKKVAKAMDEQGTPSFGDMVQRAKERQFAEENAASGRRQAFAEDSPLVAAVASGSAQSLAGAINIPTVAADFVNQSAVNPVLRAVGLPELPRAPTMIGTEYLTKAARDYMPNIGGKSMEGAWNRDEFAKWLGVKLAANSPQVAQSLAAAFIPPLRAVLLPSMGGTAAGQSFVAGDDSRVAVAKGALEIGTEMLPLKAFDKIGDVLKAMGPTKSSAVLAVAGQRLLQAGGDITAVGLTNAIEESAAQLGGNALDKYFQGKDVELTAGLAEAAVVGAATGKMMAGPRAVGTLAGANDTNSQIARAMDREIANTEFSVPADEVARGLLNPNTYDQRMISPTETARPGQVVNFTEPDSATAQAGLTPIVVPVPTAPAAAAETPVTLPEINPSTEQQFGLDKLRMGATNVSTTGDAATEPTVGGIAGGNQLGGGLDLSGSPVAGAAEQLGGRTGIPAIDAQQTVAAGDRAAQQPASVAAENNNAVVQPSEQWFGRKGDGYATEADASQAMPGRQRMFPSLDWKVEQMPSGKFRLAGYSQETALGTQTTQAQQAEAQGQQAPAAGASSIAATAEVGATTQLQGSAAPQLTLAKTAPIKTITAVQNVLRTQDKVEIEPITVDQMNNQQKLASVVANMLGKTFTVVRAVGGNQNAVPNGMINSLGGKHIFAAEDTVDAPLFVAMHEAYHGLPEADRKALNTELLKLFREENKQDFLTKFNYTEADFSEEAPAFMAQVVSKRADFWEELRTKMGNKEFASVAKIIINKLGQIVNGVSKDYGEDFANQYITDIVKARGLLTDAYAKAMQEQGLQPDVEAVSPVASKRAGEDIGAKLQERINTDFDGAAQEYAALKGTKGGRLLDTDIARELSPEYRENRNRSAEVHEAASAFIQRTFETRMSQPGTGDIVAFMAGGGGAGKSSAEKLLAPVLDRASTVLDGTLSSYDKARRNVQLALDSGRQVRIAYVYRDPEEALRNGVLTRAMLGGRTVPVDALVKGHAGASTVVRKLQEEFGDNPKFKIFAVDNSRGPGNADIVPLESITSVKIDGLKERFINATEEEYRAGRVSEDVYRATVGRQADAAARVESEAGSREVRQGSAGSVQEGRGSERAGNAVTKDEAVVDGVRYSTRKRDLVDIPTIEIKDLVGKKVFGIKADLTDAGRSYAGIDGSQLEFPVEMLGGPNFVRLPENAKANVIWAVRGGAVLTKIMEQVKKSDYVLVHAMNGNSHLTNSTISSAYLQTVESYLRDGRISKDNLKALDEIVRSPKNKAGLPDFPGFESPEIYSYIDGLSFDQRGALASILEKKEAQVHGLPNLERFRRETIDSEFAGYRQGDAMLVLKVDKENPTVKLGEEGTKLHPSYPLGLRGKVIGKLAKGVNYETIFRDYFKFAVPNFKNKEAGAWYAFDRKMPIQKITQEIADSVAPGSFKAITTARQAEAALNFANGNWLVSGKTKAQGGISVQEFVDALRANEGAAALTLYTADEVKAGIKDKSFTIYQLGKEGGDKGLQVFFGLKRGAPWYKDMIDGVGDSEVEVVSVTNNESGAPGVGIPAIITKAISEGATVLDAFAVKSKRFPNGFLPEMYAQFGFEEIGRIPFDPSYYDANQMADLKAFWSRGGWSDADGYPDVVVMRWKGNDEDRATAVERYVRSGATSVPGQGVVGTRAAAADARGKRNGNGAAARGERGTDGGQARGNQGNGDAASVVSRAFGSIQELASLGDGDIRNLGLDPAEVQRLRDGLSVRRSNRFAELARGPGARTDERDSGQSVTGIHYGKAPGLSRLSGTSFGTGIKGAEQARLAEPDVDPRIKKRVYFYLTNNNADMPRPEIGLGSHVYRATLGNMYDPSKASPAAAQRVRELMQGSGANAFESAVLDAGYRGYVNREMQTAVVLNADVPVAYEGMADGSKMRNRVAERTVQAVVTRTEGDELVRKPTNEEVLGIIKARPALANAAPSFKLQYGEARVKAEEVGAANAALAEAGASFRFEDALIDESGVRFSRRTKEDPKKTVIAYKLFRTEADRPGELFPLFVPVWGDGGPQKFGNRDPRRHGEGVPVGVWYDAEVGESAAATKTGKPQVKSKLGGLAFRPGWHAGDLPIATHIGEKSDPSLTGPDLRAPNQVWAEVEMPDDIDWQEEANKRGVNKKGVFIAKEAHITDQIPEDGFYRYKTNSNMTGSWMIGGSMKVNRILSDEEVKSINDAAGTADLPRAQPFDAEKYGFSDVIRSNRKLADDLAEQEKFLQDKAEEAGYTNVDQFMEKDYDGFVAAAAQWREENPADVMMSRRSRESWLFGRDETGRITLGAGAKFYRAAADLANNVLDRVAMKPISQDLSRAMRKMKVEIQQARELTAGVSKKLGEMSEDERSLISDVIEGELKRGVKPPKRVLEVAASMQSIMSEQTAELVRLGMLSKDAAGRWDGKYLPRFYESKFMDEGKQWIKAAKSLLGRPRTMQGIKGSSLKGRGIFQTIPVEELESWIAEGWEERDPKFDPEVDTEITVWRDYSRAERENMGEIRDAMFRFVMGYSKSQQDIALGRLYEHLANTVASKSEQEGYVQVPATNVEDTRARRYGKLAGKWVPREVMDHLSANDSSMQGDLMKFYLKGLSMWKEGKTVLNPVSHANNVLSNLTVAHFAGVSYWDAHKYIGATRDIVKNAPMLQEAKDAGLWLGTMTQAELMNMLPDQLKVLAARTESTAAKSVEQVWNAMSFWLRKPLGKAYEAEDLFFRYLIYRDARQRGLSPDESVEYAQKYIFTYDDLPKGARAVRNFALPFFSYTYKVVPMLAQTALETPWRYAAPAAAIYAANAIAYAFAAGAGDDDDDWMSIIKRYIMDPEFREQARGIEEEERKNLPSWMKGASLTLGTSKAVRLGVDEATDLPVFLDVSRMFPGGDLFDAQNNAGGIPLLSPITPNNPLLTAASALLFNKDSFTGKEVVKKTDTSAEASAKRAEWAYKQLAPAIAVGNYHFDRAMNVIANVTGEPVNLGFKEYTGVGRDGSPVQPLYAGLQTVGIKARPIDLELSAKIDQSQTSAMIRDIDAQIRSLRRLSNKGAISDAAMEKETDVLKEKRQRLKEGLTIDGEEK